MRGQIINVKINSSCFRFNTEHLTNVLGVFVWGFVHLLCMVQFWTL